jgi:hypothetical protein
VLLAAAAGSLSCAEDVRCIGDSRVIVPLEVGTRWEYRVTRTDADADTLIEVRNYTVCVLKDTLINGEIWVITDPDKMAWANRPDGFWNWYEYPYPPSEPYHMAKFPAKLGDGFVCDEEFGVYNVTVVGVREPITVPWGTIASYHYRFKNPSGETTADYFYAPGVGRIKSVHRLTTYWGHVVSTQELLSFDSPGCED